MIKEIDMMGMIVTCSVKTKELQYVVMFFGTKIHKTFV